MIMSHSAVGNDCDDDIEETAGALTSSGDLNMCANGVIASQRDLLMETIDLPLVRDYLSRQLNTLTPEQDTFLSDASKPLAERKEYLLSRVIARKGHEGLNLLIDALKSCGTHHPVQLSLGRELSKMLKQALDICSSGSLAISSLSLNDDLTSADEQTPLTSSTPRSKAMEEASASTSGAQKKVAKGKRKTSMNQSTSSVLLLPDLVISYGSVNTYLKIILLGDKRVGKSSLVQRYTRGDFKIDHKPTSDMDTCLRTFSLDGMNYILQLWDIAGDQISKESLMSVYCRGAMGAIFVYDVTNQFSLLNLGRWSEVLNSHVLQTNNDPIPSVLIGNKHDIEDLDGSVVCRQLGMRKWFYVSARSGENVNASIEYLIKQILMDKLSASQLQDPSRNNVILPNNLPPKRNDCCCSCLCS